MQETFVLTLGTVLGIAIFASFFIAILALFPRLVQRTAEAAKRMHGRAVVLGIVNLAFLAIITFALGTIGEQVSSLPLQFLTLILAGLILVGVSLGLAGMALLMGERLIPERSEIQQIVAGSGLLILSSLTPYLGWFLLLPYLCIRGVGGLFLGIFARKGLEETEDPQIEE
jgi:hypothetical protein